MSDQFTLIAANLLAVWGEMRDQPQVGTEFPSTQLSYAGQMDQIKEFIDVGEFGLAYEALVSLSEGFPFKLSGSAAVKLLEVGLLFRFKTDRPNDKRFDFR